jgi:hypothetical protein
MSDAGLKGRIGRRRPPTGLLRRDAPAGKVME